MFSLFKRRPAPVYAAVVVAAGQARRMEGIDKILTPLGDVPVLVRTLRAFEDSPRMAEVVVVTREDLLVEVSHLCKDYGLTKVSKILVGGEERLLSVRAGLREVRKDAELIAIHDGARPFLTQQVLDEVLDQASRSGAAAPAVPLTDTVKRLGKDGLVAETVDRSDLWAVQTPQVFQADLIRAAIEKAAEDKAELTDDCGAVERLGMKVVLTQGDVQNIKLTTPFDLVLAQAILTERGELR